jgi:hypothetical protein
MKTITQPNPTEHHATIKRGIDAHAKWFYVARQLDGATPQPVQKMTFGGLLLRRVQRHIEFRLPDAYMRRELLALHLPNPERVKANLRNLAEKSGGLSGGDMPVNLLAREPLSKPTVQRRLQRSAQTIPILNRLAEVVVTELDPAGALVEGFIEGVLHRRPGRRSDPGDGEQFILIEPAAARPDRLHR